MQRFGLLSKSRRDQGTQKFGLDEIRRRELECLAQTWSEHCKHKIFNSKIDYSDGRNKLKLIHF